jgi:glycerate kinase
MALRILVAPQEFKGTLTARQAAEAMARGLQRALPAAEIEMLPLADGGPGTVDALVEATRGRYLTKEVRDPLGRPVRARWGALGDKRTAVIEMAAASGLTLLSEDERDAMRASTFGTGQLIAAALDARYRQLIVGLGGSATNDGGAGAAQALGARLLDGEGEELEPGGAALARLARIDVKRLDGRLAEAEVVVATDVANPLCGRNGASLLYGAQKGATREQARALDAALAHYAEVVKRDLGIDIPNVAGFGAAGGLAAGLVAFCGATVRPGFDVVAEVVGFAERMRAADLIVTGEGRLDRQTAFGKTPAGVARAARAASKPVVAVVGSVREHETASLFDAVCAVTPDLASEADALARPEDLIARAAELAGVWWSMRPK